MAIVFAQKKPFDSAAMMELKRMSDPQISPDGKWVTFTVQTVDVVANKKPSQIWIAPLSGGTPRQITHDGETNQRARWSPDSKRIAYISDRGGSSQIWLMDTDGGDARQATSLSTEADGVLFSPTARTSCSPAKSTRSAAPTRPATRRTWTRRRTARSRRASIPSCSTAIGPRGRRSGVATCWWLVRPGARLAT